MVRELERVLKAAADVTRLRILGMLADGELCVCQIVEVVGLSQPTVSRHLLLLKQAGLVEDEKRGKWVFYRRAADGNGDLRGELAKLLSDSLRKEPALEEDLRSARHPRVRKLAACCPPPRAKPSRVSPGIRAGRRAEGGERRRVKAGRRRGE